MPRKSGHKDSPSDGQKSVVNKKCEIKPKEPKKSSNACKTPKQKATNGSTIGSTVTSNAKTSHSSVGRRRRNTNKRTESQSFTQREKKAFYECLLQKGFNCVNNERVLLDIFPNRSVNEIKGMIDSYTRRAQELNRKCDVTLDSEPNSHKQPIEKWFDIIHQLVPLNVKKDDISTILVDIFNEYKSKDWTQNNTDSTEEELIPNFGNIYDCIYNALNGRYAPKLEPIDAFVVVRLIEELKALLKRDDYELETELLSSDIFWQKSDQKSNKDYFNSIFNQRQQQNAIQATGAESEVNADIELNGDIGADGQSIDVMPSNSDNYQNYPKLRKIIECFNPLKIPISLVENEFNRWQKM